MPSRIKIAYFIFTNFRKNNSLFFKKKNTSLADYLILFNKKKLLVGTIGFASLHERKASWYSNHEFFHYSLLIQLPEFRVYLSIEYRYIQSHMVHTLQSSSSCYVLAVLSPPHYNHSHFPRFKLCIINHWLISLYISSVIEKIYI